MRNDLQPAACFVALLAAALIAALAGCCGPLVLSHRNSPASISSCTDGEYSDCPSGTCGPTLPPLASCPTLPAWPRCLTGQHWCDKSRHWRAEVNEYLQPGPAPPLKPPLPRFHPVPTQPVFAQRAGYAAPELVGADPLPPLAAPELLDLPLEEIPIPVPAPTAPQQPPWQRVAPPGPAAPAPLPAPLQQPAPDPFPVEPAPLPLKNDNVLRGPIGPVRFLEPDHAR